MPDNRAAWLLANKANPIVVQSSPYTSPGPDEILVRARSLAINPFDWALQTVGTLFFPYLNYPTILGTDVAGDVVEVGPVTGSAAPTFAVGDRVLGCALGADKNGGKPAEGAFQEYVILRTAMAAKIPQGMSYEQACVLPLGLVTAASGLFLKDFSGLDLPRLGAPDKNETYLVWGGSTSVGSNAIQLARAAGYDVVTTAGPKNWDYVRSLGASAVFDYKSPTAVRDIIAHLKGKKCAGAMAIGPTAMDACAQVLAASDGSKFIAQCSAPVGPESFSSSMLKMAPVMWKVVRWNVAFGVKASFKGIKYKFIWGTDLVLTDVARAVWNDFLGPALAAGAYRAAPEPDVVGRGIESLQEAMDINRKGVSAKKTVVTLE